MHVMHTVKRFRPQQQNKVVRCPNYVFQNVTFYWRITFTSWRIQDQSAPKSFLRYVEDSHARFDNIQQTTEFQSILNQLSPNIQYTMDSEGLDKFLQFLDLNIINIGDDDYISFSISFHAGKKRDHKCAGNRLPEVYYVNCRCGKKCG